MNTPGYEQLAAVLQAAYDQAANGKGAERHARGNPFHEQHMQTISTLLNSDDGMAFQAIKKLTEGLDFTEHDRRERELLGVIVYVAGIIVWHRSREAEPGACPECGYPANPEGTHYVTCSKLTAPKEFVEQAEQAFDVWGSTEPAAAIDDESPRAQAIGQNGNTGEHYEDPWFDAPEWAKYKAQDEDGEWRWFTRRPVAQEKFGYWVVSGGRIGSVGFGEPNPNWRDTLITRT